MKRGENIYKRRDGRWEGRYIAGKKADGKPKYGYVYGHRFSEVREKLLPLKLKYSGDKRFVAESCRTFGEWAKIWLMRAESVVKLSTFAAYRRNLEKHLLPFFAAKTLSRLCPRDVKYFSEALKDKDLSDGTQRNILRLLLTILSAAVRDGAADKSLLADFKIPATERSRVSALTRTEQFRLECAAEESSRGAEVMLALYAGLRIGEICALGWEDVDLDEGLLHIRRTVQRLPAGDGKTALYIGSPKTKTSERVVPIPTNLLEYLRRLRKRADGESVVRRGNSAVEPRALQYRFHQLLERAGVRRINFHMLRHTFAVRCLELKMDVATVSQLLGHASVKMTLDIYGDSLMEHKRVEVQELNRLWRSRCG